MYGGLKEDLDDLVARLGRLARIQQPIELALMHVTLVDEQVSYVCSSIYGIEVFWLHIDFSENWRSPGSKRETTVNSVCHLPVRK